MRKLTKLLCPSWNYEILAAITIVSLLGFFFALMLYANYADSQRKCLEWRRVTTTEHPNAALIGLGPQYMPLAMASETKERNVCVKWADE